jgi:phage-related minor tail protein
MAGSDLNIALRITADLSDAKRSLESLTTDIDDNSKAAKQGAEAQRDLGDAINDASKSGADGNEKLSDGLDDVRDSSDRASSSLGGLADRLSDGAMDAATDKILGSAGAVLGRLAGALGGLAPLAAVVAVALGAVAVALVNVNEQEARFDRQLIATGKNAATTGDQLVVLARSIGEAEDNIDTAIGVLERLVSTGKYTEREIAAIGEAATLMAALTGQSADQVAASFSNMSKSATETSVKLNEQYHFLDLATYQRIDALEKQGRTEEAIELASDKMAEAARQRLDELAGKLNWLERAWKATGNAASDAWADFSQYIKVGSGLATNAEKIAFMEQQQERRKAWSGNTLDSLFTDETAELERLKKAQEADNAKARAAADKQRAEEKGIAASNALAKQDELTANAAAKRAKAVKELTKNYDDLNATETGRKQLAAEGVKYDGKSYSGGSFDKRVNDINTRFKDPEPKADPVESYLKSLDKATAASVDASRVASVRWEREKGVLKTATEAQFQQALNLAKQQDAEKEAAKAAKTRGTADKNAFEENQRYVESLEKQLDKTTKSAAQIREQEIATRGLTEGQLAQAEAANKALTAQENTAANLKLQIQLWKANGETAKAAAAESAERYRDLRQEFERTGNTEGVQKIDVLVNSETALASLDEISKKIQELNQARSGEEQLLQAQREAGLISEYELAEKILELHKATAAEIAKLRPDVEALAQQPGNVGKQATQSLKQMDTQLVQLNNTSSMLEASLKEGLTTGLNQALSGLAKNTMSLGDAVKSLGNAVLDSLVKMASQGLTDSIVGGLGKMMGGAGAGGGWAGIASSIGSLFLADGGHVRGPGTDTSDSIPAQLSDYEYVTRASVVRQPGALPFLDDFNRRGMGALNDWASRVKHATGGLAGIPAPLAPAPMSGTVTLPEAASPNVTNEINNKLQLNLIDDPARMAEVITTPEGQEALTVVLSRNAGKFRQVLGMPS